MNMQKWYILAAIFLLIVACKKVNETESDFPLEVWFNKPTHFPEPVYKLANSSFSQAQFELGRKLFYDPILSRNNTISCGSCHISQHAFTHHGHDLSHGIDDQLGNRNSMPLMNLAWANSFFWDGGVQDLDLTAVVPIENHLEMDEKLAVVLKKLNNQSTYKDLYYKAFENSEINSVNTLKALSIFMANLISSNAKYDQVMQGKAEFTMQEQTGYQIFKNNCSSCHKEPLFTDYTYRDNGLGLNVQQDYGRYTITNREEDKLKFKVPTLRNLTYTAPYMHDGNFYTLEAVINHYRFQIKDTPNIDPLLKNKINISDEDVIALTAFLKTLDDLSFINDKRFQEQ